jgi:PTH1 family peptidyl-tRNA hydrolase
VPSRRYFPEIGRSNLAVLREKVARVIVGLGNPGERYARTRHNAGFLAVDALAREASSGGWEAECQSLVCRCTIAGQPVVLAKPLTFMNLSGQAVDLLLGRYPVGIEGIIVALDDLNLPFGRIRIRERGSAGGHRGLESVLRAVGSEEVVRVRLGIGEEAWAGDVSDFVLSEFPRNREVELTEMVLRARDALKTILAEGGAKAMSVFNA